MPLQQPTSVIPSSFAGEGGNIVAAADPVSISWQPNGNVPMTAFKVQIYSALGNELHSFTSTVNDTELNLPFYPTDSGGNAQRFVFAPKDTTWAQFGVADGNEYRLVITQYWGAAGVSNVVQTSPSAFVARSAPSLQINSFSKPLSTPAATFGATCTQAQGDGINWARWKLTNVTTGDTVEDTGALYTALLSYSYNGFLTGSTYELSLTIQTSSGVEVTATTSFAVRYAGSTVDVPITATCTADNAVEVAWEQVSRIIGVPTSSNASITAGVLSVPDGDVAWADADGAALNYKPPYCFGWRGKPLNGEGKSNTVTLFQVGKLRFKATNYGDGWYFELLDGQTVIVNYIYEYLPEGQDESLLDELIVWITPNSASMYFWVAGDVVDSYSGVREVPQSDTDAVIIFGPQECNYIYLTADTSYTLPENLYPVRTGDTYMFADFADGTYNAGLADELVSNIWVYREDGTQNVLLPIAHLTNAKIKRIKDYGTASLEQYRYRLFYESGGKFSPLAASNTVGKRFKAYSLIEAAQDETETGKYTVVKSWLFGNNLSPMQVSNNNKPSFHDNFTRYPLRVPTTPTYKSGTLTGLISNAVDGVYADTAEQAEELFAISESTNTFFIKDTKGNVYMVHTADAISASVNIVTNVQETSFSLPWQEVGSADGVSIIGEV